MKLDEIYGELINLNEISIPPDAKDRGYDYIFEIVSRIRSAQDFCTRYLVDCNQKLSASKKILLARQSEIDMYVFEALKVRKYLEQIKSFPERKEMIKLEAITSIDIRGAEEQHDALSNLKDALSNTLTNLRTAKEELNMIIGLLKQEFKDSNSGAMWNNPLPSNNHENPLKDMEFLE